MTIIMWEYVNNKQTLDYENKCDKFHEFLIDSKLYKKLPSELYFASTVSEIGNKDETICAVSSIFPDNRFNQSRSDIKYQNISDVMSKNECKDCRLFTINIMNSGKQKAENLTLKLKLNDNWVISTKGNSSIEVKDINTFWLVREKLVPNDNVEASIYIKNATGVKINPDEFIDHLKFTYEWRGMEKTLDNRDISLLHTLLIDNCKVNCKNNRINNFDIKQLDFVGDK